MNDSHPIASCAMCCQIGALPFCSSALQWATKRFEWLYDAKGRRVPPSLYVAANQEHIVSSAGICSQNSTHLFFMSAVDSRLLRRVWSNYCGVFIFLFAQALENRAVSKQHFNTTRVCGSGCVCFLRPPVTLLRCRFGQ